MPRRSVRIHARVRLWTKPQRRWAALALMACLPSCVQGQATSVERAEPPSGSTLVPARAIGRTQLSADGSYTYQWPGTYFLVAYRGPALYFHAGAGRQHLRVLLDGKPFPLVMVEAAGSYRIGTPAGGPHVVRIDVLNENQDGPKTLGHFAVPSGGSAITVPLSPRQIELIGDSYTVGYGNTSPSRECTHDQVWATTDTAHSPGALLALRYGANYRLHAISGHGVVRNYDGTPGTPVPDAYPYALLATHTPAPETAWHPQVIVISLGTNDFSTALHSSEPWKTRDELHAAYERTYLAFLRALRVQHPGALFLVWATDAANGEVATESKKVVDALHTAGDSRIGFVPIKGLAFDGCHWHPSVADDRRIADRLSEAIDKYSDVWPDKAATQPTR